MHIHLPIHNAARHQKTLHGIDTLGLDGKFVADDFHHLQQTFRIHAALGYTREETVSFQVVDAVYIQLAGNQFADESFLIFLFEHLNGHIEPSAVDFVELLHHFQREFLVRNALHDAVFQSVREGTVTAVVQQNSQRSCLKLLVCDVVALATQQMYGAPHEVHGAKAMGKTGVVRSRIYQVGHADLLDAPKPLKIWVFDNVEMQLVGDADEAIDGVVEDFLFIGCACHGP